MYGGKNTLIRASVDRREACSPDVILSKNWFFDRLLNAPRESRGSVWLLQIHIYARLTIRTDSTPSGIEPMPRIARMHWLSR